MKRPSYSKPQTLDDWRRYRLSDLFEFFAVPEHERAVLQWFLDAGGSGSENYKIGGEWHVQFIRFRQWYASLRQRGTFQKSIAELESERRTAQVGR